MMAEALEVIVPLLRGEVVTKKTDWFDLNEASSQLPPVQWPSPEVAVASAISPSGASAAGMHGAGLLSLAASGPEGYSQLPKHWQVCEETAAKHGQTVDRSNWRLVVPMHIAETREQARADMEFGTLRLADYMEALGGALGDAVVGDALVEEAASHWHMLECSEYSELPPTASGHCATALVATPLA